MSNVPYSMSIDGQRVQSLELGEAINPATEEVICQFPLASEDDLNNAVRSAQKAFDVWRHTPVLERSQMVTRLGEVIEQNKEKFFDLLIAEQGKSRAAAVWEIEGSISWCREIAKQRLPEEMIADQGDEKVVTKHTPIGVVGAITPWNFPVLLAIWKIAPALMAGNTMVLKPSPFTPLCSLLLGELALDVFPPGVFNVLSGGNEMGQLMTEHPGIGKIAFTGSTATGKKVMQSAAGNLKRLTLELGGNDPAIVMPDVNPRKVAKDLFWASFANSAQFCVACKRMYIHEDIYDEVARELVAYAKTVKVGNGADRSVELGPLQNRMQYEKVCDLLSDSRAAGLKFLIGGEPLTGKGYFIPVTIVDNPPEDARCVAEEAFGPVLPLLKFKDIEEVIRRANDSSFGLAASVWSGDLKQAGAIANRIDSGTVWINHAHAFSPTYPFGGHRQSGLGIENSLHGMAEYTNMQTIIRRALATQ